MSHYNFNIKSSVSELNSKWDSFSADSIFLRSCFLQALVEGTPANIENYFIEYFENSEMIGIALFQHIDLKNIKPFGIRESNLKSRFSSEALNVFASSILFIGNNLMSGQNAFRFSSKIESATKYKLISDSIEAVKKKLNSVQKKVHITVWKDFEDLEGSEVEKYISNKYYKFVIQPTMIFDLPASIETEGDYITLLSKKYRDQYKRARKKASEIQKRQLSVSEILQYQNRIAALYSTTVGNASFNTFHLPLDHFAIMKENLGADFQVYAYFLEEKLIGFNTVVKNGDILEPYFLGYDAEQQKSRLLYLNMLYDIVGYASAKKFKTIAFGRTALEIKSSVGAKPLTLFGFIKHSNPLINLFIAKIFTSIEPDIKWKMRNPFKVNPSAPQV